MRLLLAVILAFVLASPALADSAMVSCTCGTRVQVKQPAKKHLINWHKFFHYLDKTMSIVSEIAQTYAARKHG